MKLSKLIEDLTALQTIHGPDVPVGVRLLDQVVGEAFAAPLANVDIVTNVGYYWGENAEELAEAPIFIGLTESGLAEAEARELTTN